MRIGKWITLLLLVCLASSVEAATSDGLFGSREIRSTNMKSFSKWTDMWRRHNLPRAKQPPVEKDEQGRPMCRGLARAACNHEAWDTFVTEIQVSDKSRKDILEAVNLYMNRTQYVVDPINWGVPDYWATPDEFFMRDGDCEDYAISKYVTLKRLGFPLDDMRLVVLQDENLRIPHAVLAVTLGEETYILDNQVDAVLPDSQILHYRPVYSVNEKAWWLHQVRRFSR